MTILCFEELQIFIIIVSNTELLELITETEKIAANKYYKLYFYMINKIKIINIYNKI